MSVLTLKASKVFNIIYFDIYTYDMYQIYSRTKYISPYKKSVHTLLCKRLYLRNKEDISNYKINYLFNNNYDYLFNLFFREILCIDILVIYNCRHVSTAGDIIIINRLSERLMSIGIMGDPIKGPLQTPRNNTL